MMKSAWLARRQSSRPLVCAMQAVSMRCQGSVLVAMASATRCKSSRPPFSQNRPQQLFLRLEIVVDRGRLHLGRGGDVAHRGAVEALLVESTSLAKSASDRVSRSTL